MNQFEPGSKQAQNLARFQEIAKRGIQDRLDPDKRARFDEAVKRGLVTLPDKPQPKPTEEKVNVGAKGVGEAALTAVSGAIAEPISGLIGLASVPFVGSEAGDIVRRVQNALTYEPKTEQGKQALQNVASTLKPVIDALEYAETNLGDAGYNIAGPVGGAIGTSIPTAAAELIGIGAGRGALNAAESSAKTANKLGNKIRGGAKTEIPEQGIPDAPIEQAVEVKPDGVDADYLANKQREEVFNKLNLTPTEAQRTRSASLFKDQQDIVREGDNSVRSAIELQDDILSRAVDDAATAARDGANSSDSVVDTIVNRSLRLDEEISTAYKAARDIAPDVKNVRFDKAANKLRELAPRNERSQGTVKAIFEEMRARGLVDESFRPIGRVSVDQAENLRQYANTLVPGANAQARQIISEFKNALDDDVIKVAGEDVFAGARAAKRSFEQGLTKDKLHKFDQNRTSLVRDVLENKIAPEEFFEKAVKSKSKYKAQDLKSLKDYLLDGTEADIETGTKSWNGFRADTLGFIKDTAFIGAETRAGSRSLTRAGLDRAFRSIGEEKLKVIFSQKEIDFLKNLANIATLREPPPGTFTGSGPSGPAIKALERSMTRIFASKLPVVGELIEAGIDSVKNKKAQKRILRLVDDAEKIELEQITENFERLRKARAGELAGGATLLLAAPNAGGDEE